jgi:hypothetical protein
MEISALNQDSFLPKVDFEKPREITASEMRTFFVAICAGKWTPAANGQPDWAFKALREFCRGCRAGLRKKSIGYAAFNSDSSQTAKSFVESDMEQVGDSENEFCESDFVKLRKPTNLEELAVFLSHGKLIPLDVPVPNTPEEFGIPPTARTYLFIFIAWRELDALKTKTVSEIHHWLIRMKAIPPDNPDKDKKLGREDGSRNTRTLLKRIDFPLNKGGRPRKKNLQLPP